MKKWKLLPILMLLILIMMGIVFACKERYDLNEQVIIIDVINKAGEGASCNITTYNETQGLINISEMARTGQSYLKNLTILPKGTYSSSILCNKSGNEYEGECKFKVGAEVKMWELMIGLIMGLITFIMFYLATQTKSFDMKIIWGSFGFFLIVVDLWFLYRAVDVLSGEAGIASNILTMYEISLILFKIYFWLLCIYFMLRTILLLFDWRKKRRDEKEAWPFKL